MRAVARTSQAARLHISNFRAIRVSGLACTPAGRESSSAARVSGLNQVQQRRAALMTTAAAGANGGAAANAAAANASFPTLVSAEWLRQHLGEVTVLDASWFLPTAGRDPVAEHSAERIPGACFFGEQWASAAAAWMVAGFGWSPPMDALPIVPVFPSLNCPNCP